MFELYNDSNLNNSYYEYYTIKKGDNLYQIAKQYNVNPSLLALLNGLNKDDYIYPEQVIMIPNNNYAYYITKEGDTLDLVSKSFNSTISEIVADNKTIYLQEGQLLINKIN